MWYNIFLALWLSPCFRPTTTHGRWALSRGSVRRGFLWERDRSFWRRLWWQFWRFQRGISGTHQRISGACLPPGFGILDELIPYLGCVNLKIIHFKCSGINLTSRIRNNANLHHILPQIVCSKIVTFPFCSRTIMWWGMAARVSPPWRSTHWKEKNFSLIVDIF